MTHIGRRHSHHKPKPPSPPAVRRPTPPTGDPAGTFRGKHTHILRDEQGRATGSITEENVLFYEREP